MQKQQKAYILTKNDPNSIQLSSAQAAKDICGVIKTCLGPRAMYKMVINKGGMVELTNDGNSILREFDVSHPSVRCLVELSQTQDQECGDGTTTVMILASEMLDKLSSMVKNHHPIRINRIISYAKDVALQRITNISVPFNKEDLFKIVHGAVSTKICSILKVPMAQIAITAIESINNGMEIDIKNNIKIEKIIGDLRDTKCLDGLMFMKDIFHPAMRTSIENPKVLLIDFPLEYKKGESATKLSLLKKDDFTKLLEGEENQIRRAVDQIVSLNPDIVVTEKGISDIALGLFASKNITALRRFKKIDVARLARLSGGTTVSRPEDLQTRHLGSVGQFSYEFINNDWYCIFHKVKDPKAVTVVISGPSKDINAELERNLFDALKVAKNVMINPKLVPGGGASEYAVIAGLREAFADKDVVHKKVCNLICRALQSIPSILAKNSGADNVLELLQKLENEHLNRNSYMGINGLTGDICDVRSIIMDPIQVKEQCYKSAFDIVIQLLRVDGIVECKTKQ